MTIAQKIKDSNGSFADKIAEADKVAVDADQEWELQQTIFKFKDGSQLKAKYPDINVV